MTTPVLGPVEPTAAQLAARVAATTPNVQNAPGIPGAAAVVAQPNNGSSVPAPTSPFSSSAMPVIAKTAAAAAANATTALNAPHQAAPPANGITQNSNGTYSVNYNGQTIGSYPTQSAAANAADVLAGTGSPAAATTTATPTTTAAPVSAPTGYTAGTPDAQGNIAFTNSQTGASFTVPAGTANPGQVASNVANVQAQVASTLGNGYTATPTANGAITINNPQGQAVTSISPEVAGSPASLSEAMGQVSGYNSTVTAAGAAMAASNADNDAQYNEQMQQLQQEQDAAIGEAGASTGGWGGNSENGVNARYEQLKGDLTAQYQAQKLAISSANTGAIATANSNLQSALSSITENAKQTVIGLAQQAQTNFTTDAKNFDISTIQFPAGQNLQNLQIGSNGTTGVAGVDALVSQGVAAGYTPQQSLSLVQAGVATQNKDNQAQFLGLLQQASYSNGWSTASPAQLAADPLFNAYVGMAQSYIPSLGNNPAAAKALVSGGSIQQQKLAISSTGSPNGVAAGLTGGQGGGPIGQIAPGTTMDPNYIIPGTEGLTQSAVDRDATIMNATGKSATAVVGSSFGGSAVAKTNIINALNNRAAQMDPNGLSVVQSEQLLKGAQTTIDTASTLKATVDSAINNVQYSAGLLLGDGTTANPGLIAKVNFGTDVVWNQAQGKYISQVGAGSSPQKQADVANYLQALNAMTYEYGKIVYGSGTATVSSTQDAGEAINGYLSAYSQTQVVNQIMGEISARQQGVQMVIDGTADQVLAGVSTDDNGNTVLPTVVDPSQFNQSGSSSSDSSGSTYNGITLPN